MPDHAPLDIFRAGTHTDVSGRTLSFAAADLDATVAAYDPARHEAPLVVGHPALDAPAYGWVKTLTRDGEVLRATPAQVETQFAELVRAGRFKKISASFWLPDAPGNPAPGVYSLRHVGFLGAAAPAVKGLRAPQFAGDEAGIVTLEFAASGEETPMPETPAPAPAPTVDFAAREAALAERETALTAREAALAQAEAARARAAAVAFAETQVKAGKLLPRQQAGLVELLLALPAAPLEFADGDQTVKTEPRAWLEQFVSGLPVQVDFAERSAGPAAAPPPAPVASRVRFDAMTPAQRKQHLAAGGTVTD